MGRHICAALFLCALLSQGVIAEFSTQSGPHVESISDVSVEFVKSRAERWREYVGGSLVIRKTGKEACSVWMFPPGKNSNGWRLLSSGKEIVSAQWQGDMAVIIDRAGLMMVYRDFSRIRTGRAPK